MKHIAKNKLDVTADPPQKTYPLHTKNYLETAPAIKIFNLITFAGVFFSIISDVISAEFFQSVKLFLIDRVHAVFVDVSHLLMKPACGYGRRDFNFFGAQEVIVTFQRLQSPPANSLP